MSWLSEFFNVQPEWTPEKIAAHEAWVEENVYAPERRRVAEKAVDEAWERNRGCPR